MPTRPAAATAADGAPAPGAQAPSPASALTRAEATRVVAALVLAIFLAAVDQTVVAVALLSIARDLDGIALMPWLVSGYLIASTVATPIYGKLSDLYGRWPLLAAGITIYFAGSLLAALAQSMPQLIAFRVLQGLGGGGLIALAQATVADIAPGPERGRYQGWLSGVFATAAVAGPAIGGYLTHWAGWRAIFWINLPLAAIAFVVARRGMRRLPLPAKRTRPIDWPGAALLAAGLGAVMTALTGLGHGHGVSDPRTLVLAGAGVALLAGCALRERVASDPILPPALFAGRDFVIACAVLSLTFFMLTGASVLLPLSMQSRAGVGVDAVALRMVPLTLAVPIGAFVSGQLMLRGSALRTMIVAGSAMAAIAAGAISVLPPSAPLALAALMAMLGAGVGLALPSALVLAQTSVVRDLVGVATSTAALFRTLGGAVGVAVLSALLFATLRPQGDAGGSAALLFDAGRVGAVDSAFATVFAAIAGVGVLATALAVALPRSPARGDPGRA